MNYLLNQTKPSIPLEEVLPGDVTRRLQSIYDYMDRSILYPLRMAENESKAEKKFNQLLPKYQELRNTLNILLLDALEEDGLNNMYSGIERQVEKVSSEKERFDNSRKEKLLSSFRSSVDLSQLLFEAADNTFGSEGKRDNLDSFPEKRTEEIKELSDLIGKWELSFTVAYTAFLHSQGRKEVIDFFLEKAKEVSRQSFNKADKFIKKCPVCDEFFLMKRTNQKYCSKSCLTKARNERYRSKNKHK